MDSDSSDPNFSLIEQILAEFVPSVLTENPSRPTEVLKFLPNKCLDRLITKPAVLGELGTFGESKAVCDFIFKYGAKTIFAIVLRLELHPNTLGEVMLDFRNCLFVDTCLPIHVGKKKDYPFQNRNPWTEPKITDFMQHQHHFLAPSFSDQPQKLELSFRSILPFIRVIGGTKEGWFGEVYQLVVHADHDDRFVSHTMEYFFCSQSCSIRCCVSTGLSLNFLISSTA